MQHGANRGKRRGEEGHLIRAREDAVVVGWPEGARQPGRKALSKNASVVVPAQLDSVALVLQRVQGKVEGIDHFLASAEKYENPALSVPWLSQYIKDNPRVAVRISYVQGRSSGDKALRTFTEDMQFRDRPDRQEGKKICGVSRGDLPAPVHPCRFPFRTPDGGMSLSRTPPPRSQF